MIKDCHGAIPIQHAASAAAAAASPFDEAKIHTILQTPCEAVPHKSLEVKKQLK